MTPAEWESCTHAMTMLEAVCDGGHDRQLRAFACACCRELWHMLPNESRDALLVAEAYAEGNAFDGDLETAHEQARVGRRRISESPGHSSKRKIRTSERIAVMVELVTLPDAWRAAREAISVSVDLFGRQEANLLRQFVGNPFLANSNPCMFELITIPELCGTRLGVRVTLLGAPFLRSPSTGVIKPIEKLLRDDGTFFDGDFALFVQVRTMFHCGTYSMKIKKHLPKRLHSCLDCQNELSDEQTKVRRFEFAVSQPDTPTFRVRIDAPAATCAECGRHAILWTDQTAEDIEVAVNDALSLPGCAGERAAAADGSRDPGS